MTIWDAGTYEEEKFSDDEVIVILHGDKLDAKRVALIHTGKGDTTTSGSCTS